jgi:hypothetical protein
MLDPKTGQQLILDFGRAEDALIADLNDTIGRAYGLLHLSQLNARQALTVLSAAMQPDQRKYYASLIKGLKAKEGKNPPKSADNE